MAVATPSTGTSNGALIRWGFQLLNEHDVVSVAHQLGMLPADGSPAVRAIKAAFIAMTPAAAAPAAP